MSFSLIQHGNNVTLVDGDQKYLFQFPTLQIAQEWFNEQVWIIEQKLRK